jgi:hypothetical protein
MKDFLLSGARVALLALAAACASLLPEGALAQAITQQPVYVNSGQTVDLGAGPMEVLAFEGQADVYGAPVKSATGATTNTSTSVTLAATPAAGSAPVVGSPISGGGIPANATITAYNGTTGITISSAATATNASETITYTTGCPSSGGPQVPAAQMRGKGDGNEAMPFYTLAHVCAYGQGTGAIIGTSSVGTH